MIEKQRKIDVKDSEKRENRLERKKQQQHHMRVLVSGSYTSIERNFPKEVALWLIETN